METLMRADLEGASLMRVYTLASDRVRRHDFATAIVNSARDAGLMGATVLPGIMGYGRRSYDGELSVALYHPEHQPYVVELVDRPDRLRAFLGTVLEMDRWGRLVTIERIQVRSYHRGPGPAAGEAD